MPPSINFLTNIQPAILKIISKRPFQINSEDKPIYRFVIKIMNTEEYIFIRAGRTRIFLQLAIFFPNL